MPMSPRLLRPIASGVHPEAAAWRSAVVANGGSVSASTMKAVSDFCAAIDNASIRDRFYRLSLMAGDNLAAALVPLYRGPSRTGTQYGNTTDTNNGPFVSGDYTEASGLGSASNSTKYLDTGFPTNTLAATSRHMAFYQITTANRTFDAMLGSESEAAASAMQFKLGSGPSPTAVAYLCFDSTVDFCTGTPSDPVLVVGTSTGTAGTENAIYYNAASADTGSGTVAVPTSSNIYVFAMNRDSIPAATEHYGGRGGAYSLGLQLSASQVTAYQAAMVAFQAALGRSVP